MNRYVAVIISWFAFAIMFAVNGLANYLPINDLNTGQISALYPNRFVPDGLTFSIWGIIYLWLLIFTGYATRILIWLPDIDNRVRRIKAILPLYWITCMLNALWILVWHQLQVLYSLAIMLMLLAALMAIFGRIRKYRARPRTADHLVVEVPFIIYLAWISVATIANTTALLVSMEWNGFGIDASIWSILMIAAATALGVLLGMRFHRPAYSFVIAWALAGIYRGQFESFEAIGFAALAGMVLCIAVGIWGILKPLRGWKAPLI